MNPASRKTGIIFGLLVVVIFAFAWKIGIRRRSPPAIPATNALALLMQFEDQQAELYWKPELRAQKFGVFIDQFWNRLNASTNKMALLASLKFDLTLPQFANAYHQEFQHGVSVISPRGGSWPELISTHASTGWELEQCEFRHIGFFTNQLGRGVASTYYVSGHLSNPRSEERAIVEGNVMVWWNERPDLPPIREIDARQVKVRLRSGPPGFARVFHQEVVPPQGTYFIDPLILWDLDGNGTSEIILAARNAIYRRDTNSVWRPFPLLPHYPGPIFTAILGDFTGSGQSDFLFATFDGLFLCEGASDGGFAEPPRLVWQAQPRLKYGQAITAGDVDGDGDLDLFLGQYKVPYDQGQMPFPYFDANDGHPSFLLLNNGKGEFRDVTAAAGLGAKRARRVYSASLIDLDADADLDLVLVSDFAGLDVFENDGKGHFKDITRGSFSEPYGFGMSHALADFNRDGRLDLLMIAMNSPTADRLASLRLSRPYDVEDAYMRSRSTYGNRLFLAQTNGTFQQTPLSDTVARTGWSWGVAAADLDNDGFTDLYIANGHDTRQSVQEYEPEFWLHDIYVGKSQENSLAHAFFREKSGLTRGRGYSYGGYEKNRFFLNVGGSNFVEVAHLFGIALEQDSRNVMAEDINGDGKLDLIVTTFEAWPVKRQTLQIFENRLPDTGNWVGVEFKPHNSLYGSTVEVQSAGTHALVAGDSFRAQRRLKLHIGLGAETNVPNITVRRISGNPLELKALKANQKNFVP